MNIPNKIKVGGKHYTIIYTNEVSEEDHSRDAVIVFHKQEIRIRKDMAKEYTETMFLHEVLHAIFNYMEIRPDDEEEMINKIANCLHQVLTENEIFGRSYNKEDNIIYYNNGMRKIKREGYNEYYNCWCNPFLLAYMSSV